KGTSKKGTSKKGTSKKKTAATSKRRTAAPSKKGTASTSKKGTASTLKTGTASTSKKRTASTSKKGTAATSKKRTVRKRATSQRVSTLTHEGEHRKNIPTAEYQSLVTRDAESPLHVMYRRRNRDLDPQLMWRGKDERDWSDLV